MRKDEKEETDSTEDAEFSLGPNFSIFASASYEDLDRDQTAFEDGYDSDVWGVTIGADYLVNNLMIAGLAINLNRWEGDFDSGGDFDTDSYGATAFVSFLPLRQFFIDVAFGYARNDVSENRTRVYDRIVNDATDGTTRREVFGGEVDHDRDDDLWSAFVRMGYDIPIGQFTIGPRFAFDWRYTDIEQHKEKGSTGLELKYQSDSRTQLQSRLGLQALMAISTNIGVFVPRLYARWVHEFADEQRSISVQFVQDLRPDPTRFSFDSEEPDENFWEIGAGLVLVMPHGFQAFMNVESLQNHEFLDSTSASAGLRIDF